MFNLDKNVMRLGLWQKVVLMYSFTNLMQNILRMKLEYNLIVREKIENSIVKHYNCTICGYLVILIDTINQFLLAEFFKCILTELKMLI